MSHRHHVRTACSVAMLLALAGAAAAQPTTFRAIALQPELLPVPSALRPAGAAFVGQDFNWASGSATSPSINQLGQVNFAAPAGPGVSPPLGLWHWNGSVLQQNINVALYGTTTIGGQALTSSPGAVFSDSNNGTAWRATLGGQTAYVTNTTGTLGVVAQNATPSIIAVAPGGTGTINWSSISTSAEVASGSGAVMFTASLANSTGATGTGLVTTAGLTRNDSGLFIGTPGSVTTVARAGTVIGNDSGTNYAIGAVNTGARWSVNASGNAIFQSTLQGTTINTTSTSSSTTTNPNYIGTRNDQVMMLGTYAAGAYSLTTLARGGAAAPGAPSGVIFDQFGNTPGINNAGQHAFIASLRNAAAGSGDVVGASGATQNNTALFANTGGSLTMLARQGQAISAGSSVTFGLMSGNALVNNSGVVSMVTALGGTAPNGTNSLFTFSPDGVVSELIRTGVAFPSAIGSIPAGASLGSFQGGFCTNAMNAYVFRGLLTQNAGLGINNTNYNVLMAITPSGELRLIARSGDAWDAVNGGPLTGATVDARIITSISFSGGSSSQDGRASGFNDAGQITFGLDFNDAGIVTSGIYTATVVPTPSVAGLLGLAGLGVAARRRR